MPASTFDDFYKKALLGSGLYMGGLYVLALSDVTMYFVPYVENKKGSWKGLAVAVVQGKRKPSPAKIQNVLARDLQPTHSTAAGWKRISPESAPAAVLERFAEKAASMPEF